MAKGKLTIKGANPADKQQIALARAANKAHATPRPDEMPEAKTSPADKSKAAAKVFKDADEAVALEQHEAGLRRSVYGY